MQNYKIIVAYDGTDYHGWQIQPEVTTITQVLQDKFKYAFKKDIKITGASRTDAGVHALGQVAQFMSDMSIAPDRLKWAWNNVLPEAIIIRSLEAVAPEFHPQRHVLYKTYYYHIFEQRPLPLCSRYGWYPKKTINITKLQEALQVFVGTHDFRSFCTGYEQESTVRTIHRITITYIKRLRAYRIEITGPGFLRYMIRRIVGAAVEIAATQTRNTHELITALDQKNPEQTFLTAPAQGLVLYKIKYK
jgi:tRNA pseudouridine38-40 synthase